jgi:outer membrane biosynthesis protein TonB
MRRTLIWLAVAPLGIGLTTGLTITTTLLTQQPIGLASEPLSAGDALAPPDTKAVAGEAPAHAAKPARALLPHGGRALSTSAPRPPRASVPPPAITPPPPAPVVTPPPPPAPAKPVTPAKHVTPAKQPAHATTKHVKTSPDEHGGGDSQPSTDGGRSDNSGHGARDD